MKRKLDVDGRISVEVIKCAQVRRDKSGAGTKKTSAKTTYYPYDFAQQTEPISTEK